MAEPRGVQKLAEELSNYCQNTIGENLRAVTGYGSDYHTPIYTRENILREIKLAEDERQMFRHPFMQMHKGVWELSNVHPTLRPPDIATYSYGDVLVLQFPITKSEGIIVTLDRGDELPSEFISRCKSIVRGRD